MRDIRFFYIMGLVLLTYTAWGVEPTLKFNDKGRFKIIQFTDLHWIESDKYAKNNDSTLRLMEQIIRKEQPDLVVITGDVVVSANALDGWEKVVQPMVKHRVPFAVTFGNHDIETDVSTMAVLEYLDRFPMHVTYNANSKVDGVGNCVLPIMSSDGASKKWILYLFDSHSYPVNKELGGYDWVKQNQIQWYREQRDSLASEAGGILPSLAFFHIPTPEYTFVKNDPYSLGTKGEDVCSPLVNSGLTGAFLERQDVMATFVGHDHNNDFIGTYLDRICLAYGRKTGYNSAYSEILDRGARVINVYEDDRRFDTHIQTLSDATNYFAFEQKVDAYDYPVANGTFIQDFLVANWDDARWQQEFATLRAAGMQYMVYGPALHIDKLGAVRTLYPSTLPGAEQKSKDDLIDACLRNAEKAGFKVFLGLNFNENWWSSDFAAGWLDQQMEIGNSVADELSARYADKYPRAFYGWYWVWEVANIEQLTRTENRDALARALNVNLDYLNQRYPDMPFMLAPYMNHRIGTARDYGEMWKYVFSKTNFKPGDIFAPQDCVGAGGLDIGQVPTWFKELEIAVKSKPVLRFWSDAETFDQRFWTSTTLDRFVHQMNLVAPYVSGIITFAYSHYYSPSNDTDDFHQAYLRYTHTGALPVIPLPAMVEGAVAAQKHNGVRLKWKAAKSSVSGYFIYRDGVRIADMQRRKKRGFGTDFLDKEGGRGAVYEIAGYNVVGAESARTRFDW